jgi:hydrogenase-4 component F
VILLGLALVVVPALAALMVWLPALRGVATRVLVGTSVVTATLAVVVVVGHGETLAALHGVVRVDATSRLFLAVVDPIFVGIAVFVWYRVQTTPQLRVGIHRSIALALVFLAAANAVLICNHLLASWVALEATTLALAPLIVRPGQASSRRASWHYLLFSSVGLGLVLLGFLCLQRGMAAGGIEPTLLVDRLRELGTGGANPWSRLGLALVLLGLGSKLGLAPMYSWLPDAYDEAPPAVAAFLGAVQFNCTFVVLLRVVATFRTDHPALVEGELLAMGIVSMMVSTGSIIATRNLKRLIAYAAINHAGVLAIGLGVGKPAAYGVLLYAVSNAFIKAILFLTAGKIRVHYRTKDTREITGLIRDLPYSGIFLMLGTFALLGLPPFGSFFGELLILSALVGSGQMLVFAAFCVLITVTFIATGRTVFPMIWGETKSRGDWPRQTLRAASPKIAFLAALVVLGVCIPPAINALLQEVASTLGGR